MMWSETAANRPTISSVVHQSKQFAEEQDIKNKSRGKTPVRSLGAGGQSLDLEQFVFSELESTIKSFLDKLERKCRFYSKSQEAVRYIFQRALDIHRLIRTQHRLPSNATVVSYCEVLLSLDKFLGNAIHEKSVLLRTKSQKVAMQSHQFHRWLDELLGLLASPTIDLIHKWEEHFKDFGESVRSELTEDEQVSSEGGEASVPTTGQARVVVNSGPAVTIKRYESKRLNERFRALDFEAIRAASANEDPPGLPWLIRSYNLKYGRNDRISAGAFGEVYKATWRGTSVVVKLWVKLYGACHIGKVFFVCECAGNGNLVEYLKRDGNADKSWQLLHHVALGLQYLHNDLKDDNILIGANGDAKLTNFGLSSILNSAEVEVTKTKQGAQQWKSPEYIRGNERLTLASDIYSFGMCILETMTGKFPRGGMVDAAVRHHVLKGNLPNRPSCLTDAQWSLIQMMCAKEPSQRVKIAFVVDKLYEFLQQ